MSSSTTPKICFNLECRDPKPEKWRKGWRLRNYDFANLCDRCGSIYEEGRFCETFHKYASGWRSCERCGKRVHCGCIVSMHAFVVLDAGGIECTTCSRKTSVQTSNPTWPPRPSTGWLTEGPIRNWNQAAGSGSSGSWLQAVNMFNKSVAYSDLKSRTSFEANGSTGFERLQVANMFNTDRCATFPLERHGTQNLPLNDGRLKHNATELLERGKTGMINYPKISVSSFHFIRPMSYRPSEVSGVDNQCVAFFHPAVGNQADYQRRVSVLHPQQLYHQDVQGYNSTVNSHVGVNSPCQPQIHYGKTGDMQAWKELLPQYWPKISDEALQCVSGGYPYINNLVHSHQTLSASDTGRIGRLVLPKKCAEIYFPAISQPEGLPLKVQDIKGKEWIFQFRFWPNNNSRMYVLEGITNCIQSLQLRAGDVVTFSRVEPEGKLIMGFRKVSNSPQSEQGTQATKAVNETHSGGDIGIQKPKINDDLTNCHLNSYRMSECHSSGGQLNTLDVARVPFKSSKSGYVTSEAVDSSSSIPCKRKNGAMCPERKCLKLNNVDILEVMVTLEEAQGLFRAPPSQAPNVVIIEDFVFEEYEDAPVIGRPTVIAKGSMGVDIQWAQCDSCLKWRKLPSDFLLPARWTCSQNPWDPNRSSCDTAQELTSGQLNDLLSINAAALAKVRDASGASNPPANSTVERDADTEASLEHTQLMSKHPRHKPGCSCVVCNQPSSGKTPKHQTLSPHHHQRNQSGKETAIQCPEKKPYSRIEILDNGSLGYVNVKEKMSYAQIKGQIDLNSHPDREEEASSCSELVPAIKMASDSANRGLQISDGKVNPSPTVLDKYKLVFEVSSGRGCCEG